MDWKKISPGRFSGSKSIYFLALSMFIVLFVLGKIRELSMSQIANHFGGGLCADEIFDKMKFLDFIVKDIIVLADFIGDSMKLR